MQHGSKYYAHRPPIPPPPPDPGGQKVKIQLFQNMVILHIELKAIMNACSNMIANILPAAPLPPLPPTLGLKGQI